jgi:hypothetical protein
MATVTLPPGIEITVSGCPPVVDVGCAIPNLALSLASSLSMKLIIGPGVALFWSCTPHNREWID